jgi:hypothetical protein
MITITDLQTALLDLLQEIRGSEIRLIIGGGFGIYLKTDHAKRLNKRTLLDQWPEPLVPPTTSTCFYVLSC